MGGISMGRLGQVMILVNGDSFCDERYFEPNELLINNQKWSETIGAVNIAHGGCSNERIFYSTIEYLNNNPIDVLIIGWTDWNRHMTTLTNGLELHICPNGAGDNVHPWMHGKNYKFHVENHYKYFHNEYLNFKYFLDYYLHLQNYCLLKNIKFLNFFSVPDNMPREMELYQIAKNGYLENDLDKESKRLKINSYIIGLKTSISKISKKHWINEIVGYSYNVFAQKFPKANDGYHPGVQASSDWSRLIKKHLI